MADDFPSPNVSRQSSRDENKSPLTLDLSDLPALVQPSPPSNTLIVTNLQEPEIFHPANLIQIRDLISQHCPIHTWAPLKSFRRIVVSFFDIPSAITIRQTLDGETLMGHRIRIYFGQNTPIKPTDQHLPLPKADKMFFISPPPSPPHGWEMHNEDAPNKVVHAEDLASALAKLHAAHIDADTREGEMRDAEGGISEAGWAARRRGRSGTGTIVYHPEDHGDSPDLPAIAVEDTTLTPQHLSPVDAMEGVEGAIALERAQGRTARTSRPPVELMG